MTNLPLNGNKEPIGQGLKSIAVVVAGNEVVDINGEEDEYGDEYGDEQEDAGYIMRISGSSCVNLMRQSLVSARFCEMREGI